MRGEKILITGPAGQIAFPLCAYFVPDNEVWGVARFSDPAGRAKVEALGVTTRAIDLAAGDLSDLPDDFTYVLHLAVYQGSDFDRAFEVNAEGTGRLLAHCRTAKASSPTSTAVGVLGGRRSLPCVYRDRSGRLPPYAVVPDLHRVQDLRRGRRTDLRPAVRSAGGHRPYERLLREQRGAADVPPRHHAGRSTGCHPPQSLPLQSHPPGRHQRADRGAARGRLGAGNRCQLGGDDVVTPNEWCAYYGELTGRTPDMVVQEAPGTMLGNVLDPTKRIGITGPCTVGWKEGLRRVVAERHPESLVSP